MSLLTGGGVIVHFHAFNVNEADFGFGPLVHTKLVNYSSRVCSHIATVVGTGKQVIDREPATYMVCRIGANKCSRQVRMMTSLFYKYIKLANTISWKAGRGSN